MLAISDSSSMLEEMHIENIILLSSGVISSLLQWVRERRIDHNNITDEAGDTIVIVIKHNTSLIKLKITFIVKKSFH